MAKRTRHCALCGTEYKYCNGCAEYDNYPYWMNMFCSEECLKSFEIISTYASGGMSKDDAKKMLSVYSSDKRKLYKGSIVSTYNEIMAEDVPVDTEEELKGQDEIVEEIQKDIAEETVKEVVANATKESKKFYPKSVAHKKG